MMFSPLCNLEYQRRPDGCVPEARETQNPVPTPHHLQEFQKLPSGNSAGYLNIPCTKIIGEASAGVNEA